MPRNLARLYEWQAEMMEWVEEKMPSIPMAQKLYIVQVVMAKNKAVQAVLDRQQDYLDVLVNIDAFIAHKVLCVTISAKYDRPNDLWKFDIYDRSEKTIYNEEGEVKVRHDLNSEGCAFVVPHDDNDQVETLLQEHMRVAYEEAEKEDVLTDMKERLLAWDFFKAGWMKCVKKYLNPARAQNYDGIYIEGWKNNERVYSFMTSSDDPGHECSKMDGFLELERAVRLRGVEFKPHRIGHVFITPAPIAESGTEAKAT